MLPLPEGEGWGEGGQTMAFRIVAVYQHSPFFNLRL